MIKKATFTVLFFIVFSSLFCFAQHRTKKEPSVKDAKDNYSNENYNAALKEYLLLVQSDSRNVLYNYRIGVCYLNTNVDKAKAVHHLEYVTRQPEFDKQTWYELGRAYHFAYKFDEAIKAFNNFKEAIGNRSSVLEDVDRQIEMCYNAKELIKFPLQVTFENLGKEVNSEYPDYYPFVTENESYLVYTSRRKGNIGGYETFDGYYTSDIFISGEKSGKWSKAKNIGPMVNTDGDDEAVSMSDEGNYLFIYSENEFDFGDIFVSSKKGRSFKKRLLIDNNVNSADLEVAASINGDEDLLFFSSSRTGGLGELDIYMTKKLPTGQWAIPVNLGPSINSKYNEDFPVISKDGKTLYFSSQGHASMGGFDLFKSTWNEDLQQWSPAENIGYPINTPEDNMTISFAESGRFAYISATREEGLGDLDIYRLTFSGVEPSFAVIKGVVKTRVPINYDEEKTVHVYKKGDVVKKFPNEFKPPLSDTSWVFQETTKITVKEGMEFKTILVFEKDGTERLLSLESYAKVDSTYIFKDVRSGIVKMKGFVAPPANRPVLKEVIVPHAFITLSEISSNEIYGTYLNIPSTGKFMIIAPPGNYNLTVEVEGYKIYSEDITVFDKSSFEAETEKDIFIESLLKK